MFALSLIIKNISAKQVKIIVKPVALWSNAILYISI